MLTDIMNDHGLEQLVHFATQEENTLDLFSLPGYWKSSDVLLDICQTD